jgi:hypothetical protein
MAAVGGNVGPSPNVQDILAELRDIKAAVLNLFQIVQNSSDLSARVQKLEIRNTEADVLSERAVKCAWICPVCRSPFKHRESFKGHILRLKEPVAKRTHCFFDAENPVHVALLSHPRFGTGDFGSRGAAFASQFYDTVRSCSSSSRSSESSHAAVSVVCLPSYCVELWQMGSQIYVTQCFRFKLGCKMSYLAL